MKLGIFDSGLGGLTIARAVYEALPELDMLYYGDTLHVPYGNRSDEAIYGYTRASMELMFEKGCQLIVMACNTASAAALRRLQQTWLPESYPGRNIIGVVVPTLEAAIDEGFSNLGLIGTNYIIRSEIFKTELQKINPAIRIHQVATPLLVPLIENDGGAWVEDVLASYVNPLLDQRIECLILGCTHYASIKVQAQKVCGPYVRILSQDDLIPAKLRDYLDRHAEYADAIGKSGKAEFFVSDLTESYLKGARQIYGKDIEVVQI
jgi:glutamate racemase